MTVVRAGGSPLQKVRYTSFIAAKSPGFFRYTVTLAALARLDPAVFSVAPMFSSTCLVCALIPPAPVPSTPDT